MSMVVASYAPASRSPVTRASSGARRVSHTQSWRPPPPPFFPASAAVKCRRPTLPVARSVGPPEKHRPVLNIPPTERWEIKDDEGNVQLWLQVPGLTEDDLEITTTDELLEIKRKAGRGYPRRLDDVQGVGSFHLRLLLTKEFVSSQVTAELKAGMLEVTIPKNTNLRRTVVRIGQQSQSPAAVRTAQPKVVDPPPANSPPKNNNLVRNTSVQSRIDPPARESPKNDLGVGISVQPNDSPAREPPKNNLAGGRNVPTKDDPPARELPKNNLAGGRNVPPKDDPPARELPKNNLAGGRNVPPKDDPPAREPPKNNLAGGRNVAPKDDPPANEAPRNNLAGGTGVPTKDPPRNANEPPKNPPGTREANLGGAN
uniref:SHSP domain-containing protein n=1 Tax=Oryza nivara TaxID=4536 RepID=A0A0E0IPU9_ORYNI